MMRGMHCARSTWSFLLLSLWFSVSPQVWAQQVIGKADGIGGTALKNGSALALREELAITNTLETQPQSKLDILAFRPGSKFALGEKVE
jgi:hypothetical protein